MSSWLLILGVFDLARNIIITIFFFFKFWNKKEFKFVAYAEKNEIVHEGRFNDPLKAMRHYMLCIKKQLRGQWGYLYGSERKHGGHWEVTRRTVSSNKEVFSLFPLPLNWYFLLNYLQFLFCLYSFHVALAASPSNWNAISNTALQFTRSPAKWRNCFSRFGQFFPNQRLICKNLFGTVNSNAD